MDKRRAFRWITILVVTALYISFRFWNLTDSCLWFDEIFSVHAAEHSWNDILAFVAADLIHPPLFYIVLKLWMLVGGDGLYWLRLLPVVFSILALAPFYLFARELKLTFATSLLAFFLIAVNGSLIRFSHEVRMYGMLLVLSLTSFWLFARYFNRGKGIAALTLVNLLLVYTHYYGWLAVFAELVAIFWLQRIKIRAFLISAGIVVVAFIPWLMMVRRAASAGSDINQNVGWIERPGISHLFRLAFDIIEPFYYQQSNIDPSTIIYVSLPILLVIITSKILFYSDWRERALDDGFRLLGIFFGIPVLSALVLSWMLPVSVWGMRHLIIVIVPALILAAYFVVMVKQDIVRYSLIGMILLASAIAFTLKIRTPNEQFIWCAWGRLANEIPAGTAQTIYTFEDDVAYHTWFALRKRSDVTVVKVEGVMIEDKSYFLPRAFDDVEKTDANAIAGDHFWLAFRDMKWDERHPPLADLSSRGYKIVYRRETGAQGLKAFVVEMQK